MWFSVFPGTGASNILLSSCPSSLRLTQCSYHFSLFSVNFFVTGATFTDPLTWSFLILSFFVTPHIHRSILVSFTSSLFAWLFIVDCILQSSFTSILQSVACISSGQMIAQCFRRYDTTCVGVANTLFKSRLYIKYVLHNDRPWLCCTTWVSCVAYRCALLQSTHSIQNINWLHHCSAVNLIICTSPFSVSMSHCFSLESI